MKKFFCRIADHLLDFVVSTVISLIGTYIATSNFLDIGQLPKDSVKIVMTIFMLTLIVCILIVRFCRNAFRHQYKIRTLEVRVFVYAQVAMGRRRESSSQQKERLTKFHHTSPLW